MKIAEAKGIVKAKYPRAICRYYDLDGREGKQKFAIQSYRCGQPITHKGITQINFVSSYRTVGFPTQGEAWIAAAEAIQSGADGDLNK